MSYKDYTYQRSKISAMSTDATFASLIKESAKLIHALGYFYEVGTRIRAKESTRCPACVLSPLRREVAEQGLGGPRYDYRYTVQVGFIVKGPNDCVVMQQVLFMEEKIRNLFAKGSGSTVLTFSGVSGHYNTIVESTPIEPIQMFSNNVLAFNSGIELVFSVWETES